jgi:hypothetical protein
MPLFGRRRTAPWPVGAARRARESLQEELEAFVDARDGVEAFLEPASATSGLSLLLVAGDGESTRRPVESPKAANRLAAALGVPLYEVNRVGYPQRMRDYALRQQGRRPRSPFSTAGPTVADREPATPTAYSSPREREAIAVLERAAGDEAGSGVADEEALGRLFRRARAASHPDRFDGDRVRWDEVEQAGRVLGL